MTRVYQSNAAQSGFRVLLVGAGAYPNAKTGLNNVPALSDLFSVRPSVEALAARLLGNWFGTLRTPLVSLDMLLSSPDVPGGASWPGYGKQSLGEVAVGTPLSPPTFDNISAVLGTWDAESCPEDTLLLLFCGHGFFKESRYFLTSDFGVGANPWIKAINLDNLSLALRQLKPRNQWMFWDSCANIPQQVLDVLGVVGCDPIGLSATKMVAANALGTLSQFGIASSPVGEMAYGTVGQPSRFTQMLVEAIDQVGSTKRLAGQWWVTDRGLVDALQSYGQRHPELDPTFYSFIMPFNSDAPQAMQLRVLAKAPTSTLVAKSNPLPHLLTADLKIAVLGAVPGVYLYDNPARPTFVFSCQVPAQERYSVSAKFPGDLQARVLPDIFADLPLAEDVEFILP